MTSTQARWPIVNAIAEWFRPTPYERDLEFLEKCHGEEMERLRAHMRGRPEDLNWLVGREPDSSELLCHMMDVVNVDPRKVPEKTLREMERACAKCSAKFHCADEIGNDRAANSFEGFCPNAERLRALQESSRS